MPDWGTIVGWVVMVFGGGAAWGQHKRQLTEHQKVIDNCKMGELLSIDRHKEICDSKQAPVMIQLKSIESMLNEMKSDRRKFDERLGALSSKLDVLDDRWGRNHG